MNNWISYNKVELFCNFSIQPETTAPFMLRSGKIRRERSCRSSTTTPSFHMKKVLSWTYLFHFFINIFIAPSFHHFMYQKMFFQYLNLKYCLRFTYWNKIKSCRSSTPLHHLTTEKGGGGNHRMWAKWAKGVVQEWGVGWWQVLLTCSLSDRVNFIFENDIMR